MAPEVMMFPYESARVIAAVISLGLGTKVLTCRKPEALWQRASRMCLLFRCPNDRQRGGVSGTAANRTCKVSNRVHDNIPLKVIVSANGQVKAKCMSEHCKDSEAKLGCIQHMMTVPYNRIITAEESKFILPRNPVPAIKVYMTVASMGLGKSTEMMRLIKYLLSANPAARILLVSNRISLATQLGEMLSEQGFMMYNDRNNARNNDRSNDRNNDRNNDREQNPWRANLLICQYQSLKHTTHPYEYVFLDEFSANLTQSTSTATNKENLSVNWDVFTLNVKHSIHTWIFDADSDMSNRTAQFLNSFFKPEEIYAEKYLYVQNPRSFVSYKDHSIFLKHILNDLQQGKKVCVCAGTKVFAHSLEQLLQKENPACLERATFITGDTDDEIKRETFKNVNAAWKDKDLVVYTSTITTGISCTLPFDRLYLYAHSMGCKVGDMFQMMGRLRVLKDVQARIYIHPALATSC